MASNKQKRRALFELYAKNLSLVCPDLKDVYACPLCPRPRCWDISAADEGILTLEHIIPDQIGPRREILTCKDCNNRKGGSSLDFHLHHQVQIDSWDTAESKYKMKCRVDIGGTSFPARIEKAKPGESASRNISVDLYRAAPADKAAALETVGRGGELRGTILIPAASIPNERRVKIAELKIAYLLMFRQYGYSYIKHPALEQVRRQIRAPMEDLLPIQMIVRRLPELDVGDAILRITQPTEMQAYIAPLKLGRNGNFRYIGVVMPLNSLTYTRWAGAEAEKLNFTIEPYDLRYLEYPGQWSSDPDPENGV